MFTPCPLKPSAGPSPSLRLASLLLCVSKNLCLIAKVNNGSERQKQPHFHGKLWPITSCFPLDLLSLGEKSTFILQNIPKRKTPATSGIPPRIVCLGLILLHFVNLIFKIYHNISHTFLETFCFFNFTLKKIKYILDMEDHKQQKKSPSLHSGLFKKLQLLSKSRQ